MKTELIREEGYEASMNHTVLPYDEARREEGTMERRPGETLVYEHYRADEERAVLVLVHGFSESIRKYRESVYYFLQEGYSVWLLQQRSHGASFRPVPEDPSLIEIADFHDLVEDLHYFVHEIVMPDNAAGRPLYLFGHSMGGGVSACYLETYPEDFAKAILSSPMLDLDSGGTPVWVLVLYARRMHLFGRGTKYLPGAQPFSDQPDFKDSCTNSRERYDWYFRIILQHRDMQTSATSLDTAYSFLKLTRFARRQENVDRIRAKVCMIQAGKDGLVPPAGQNEFMEKLGDRGKKIVIPEAKHEIYRCCDRDMALYWPAVFSFLAS